MLRTRLKDSLHRVGVEMATSVGHLAEALHAGDTRRVLSAFVGFTVAEMANFIAILIYAYDTGGPADLGIVACKK